MEWAPSGENRSMENLRWTRCDSTVVIGWGLKYENLIENFRGIFISLVGPLGKSEQVVKDELVGKIITSSPS